MCNARSIGLRNVLREISLVLTRLRLVLTFICTGPLQLPWFSALVPTPQSNRELLYMIVAPSCEASSQ
jgi:hypothetical protein